MNKEPLEVLIEKSREAAQFMRMHSDQTRLLILCHLIDGPMSVNEIKETLGITSQSNISQHLSKLKKSNLIESQRRGKEIYYSISSSESISIIGVLKDKFCG